MSLPRGSALTEPDYGKKLEILAREYLDYDVRTLTGTTCWFSLPPRPMGPTAAGLDKLVIYGTR